MQLKLDGKLEGQEYQKLQKALLSAFPTLWKLRQMVRYGLEENLDAVAKGDNDEEVVFNLIAWAEANGKLKKLLTAACGQNCGGNPNNPELKPFCQQLCQEKATQEQAKTKQSHEWLNPCNFDLHSLISESCNNLLGKKGLIGLAVPCDDHTFLKNFCQRLKNEFSRKNIQIQDSLSLNPKYTAVKTAVQRIQRCKTALRSSDIISPIQIQVSDQKLSITHDFWQQVVDEFKDPFEHRLIIIMWGSEDEDTIFPQDVIQLKSPQFTAPDVVDWVLKVSRNLEWEEEDIVQWKKLMIDDCCLDDPESNQLNTGLVYDHLNFAIPCLLQILQQNLSAKDFLQPLRQRIQSYV